MTTDSTTIQIDDVRMRSRSVILNNQHPSGAFPAAVNYSVYNYCWFRDGAFIADSLSRVGEREAATRFHEWCGRVVEARRNHIMGLVERKSAGKEIPGSEMLPTRFTLDGDDGTEDWWDFQLDGYGTWLWALNEHICRYDLDAGPFLSAIETTVAYLSAFGDHPCFDWWEEFEEHRHLSTLCSIVAGVESAGNLLTGDGAAEATNAANRLRSLVDDSYAATGHLTKWIGSEAVDGSLLSAFVPFAIVEPGSDVAEATYQRILADLVADGVYRYQGDTFYGGGEWINLTAWLGLYELATGRIELALSRRDWIVGQATDDGDLPEQVSGRTQAPDRIEEWERRWGRVATPLLWSHAMFLTLDLALQQQIEATG
ncbi:MAG: glycoside hydrolase family 15 [Acidimicrobiia bacterium]|nr:glycoside hydrolase family 15 [Acidimicrobiia bacterium]